MKYYFTGVIKYETLLGILSVFCKHIVVKTTGWLTYQQNSDGHESCEEKKGSVFEA